MDRNTVTDSIYDRYMTDDGENARQSSAPSMSTAEHLSLAPPMPRLNLQNNARRNVHSTADTSSVYTTATTPYERWSLEQGLDSRQSAMGGASTPPLPPSFSTRRPPDSPSLSQLRNISSKEQLPRLNTGLAVEPSVAHTPTQPSPSPIMSQQPRRHFSRPFRPSESLAPEQAQTQPPMFTTPTITINRFSAATPDAYGGAAFDSPAIPQMHSDSPRSSTYSSDIAAFPEPGHLRKRSNPTNNNSNDGVGKRGSMDTVKEALAARHIHRNSLADLSVIESVDEEFDEKPQRNLERPFSASNSYPFTSATNAFSQRQSRAISPKPSSRFSDDEKRGFQTLSENNDYQASAWNLFGRSPAPLQSRWTNDAKVSGTAVAAHSAAARKQRRKRVIWIVVGALALVAVAGAGAGVGVWRNNAARLDAAATVGADNSDSSSSSVDNSDVQTAGASATSASASASATAVPGSGGAGGYYSIVSFGGSYSDNGHIRDATYASTLKAAPYYEGRSSNGLIYADYLSSMLGPQIASGGSALAINYAYAGAFINNSVTYAPIPDLPQQVSAYLGDLNNGNATITATAANKTLVTLWAGMEQLITVWQAARGSNPDNILSTAQAGVDTMLSSLAQSLSWLIPTGNATHATPDFALISLPEGNLLPEVGSSAGGDQDLISIFRNLTDHFNTGLASVAAALNATTVYTFNAQKFLDSVISSASQYSLNNTADSCIATSCTDPSAYVWYDGINPSTTIHRLVAKRLAQAILKS